MRLRSWEQLEELLEFIRASRFMEAFDSPFGYTSNRIVKGIIDELKNKGVKRDIRFLEFSVYKRSYTMGDLVLGFRSEDFVVLEIKDRKGVVGLHTLYRRAGDMEDDE